VECGDGIFFPFSRGCSFITLNSKGQIQTVRPAGQLLPARQASGKPAADFSVISMPV
jgi:hypothetical protein